jgi:hypothetical protein
MSRFNTTSKGKSRTTNHVGATTAFKQTAEMELISILLTSFVQDSYYEKANTQINRLSEVLGKVNPKFAAKAAVYARNEFGMRSISHVLSVELVKYASGQPWAKNFFNEVVRRPDDMTEIVSYYFSKGNKKLPNSLKKGLAKAFDKFDRYQLAKYRGENKDVSLIDVVNLVHPVPTQKNADALTALVKDELKSVDTWEAKLSEAGKGKKNDSEKNEAKAEAWKEMLESGKMPYFALLRNLRNIIEQAPELVDKACAILVNEKLIKGSLVLPFRFLSAYNEIEALKGTSSSKTIKFEKEGDNVTKVLSALEKAVRVSVVNLPELAGNTVILSDNSGSMTGDRGGSSLISRLSNVKTSDIANLFAMLYWLRSENTYVGLFGDRLIEPNLNRELGVFENFKIVDQEKNKCGGSTEQGIFEFFRKAIKEKTHIDTLVVFSDCQIGDGCKWYGNGASTRSSDFNKLYEEYRRINPNFRVYSVDLKGYGTTVFNDSVFKLAGWSEKIFDIMKIMEQDRKALIRTIENYTQFED